MATETGLNVYQVAYTPGKGYLTITSHVAINGNANGTVSITLPASTSPTLDYLDTGSNQTATAANNDVYDSTLSVHNAYIGTVDLPNGVQGFLVQDLANKNYYIFTTTLLPATGVVGTATHRTVNVSTTNATSGPGANANWNASTGTPYTTCFLAGAKIRTPGGDVAVESLREGDPVITLDDGKEIAKPVTWLGYRHVKPGDFSGDDAHPIRIKAGAFADGIPYNDLLITGEHCIFVNGGLIPARMLVNNRSIIIDRGISSYTYYHVELASHAILLAEGLATESYLDTGSRDSFANAQIAALRPSLAVNPAHKSWADAAAPLMVVAGDVWPVWLMLNIRAERLGMVNIAPAPVLINDPDLHLVSAAGAVIRPLRMDKGRALFMLPAGAGELSLVSRTAKPSETIAPFIDDRRALGVLVGDITLYNGRHKTSMAGHLANAKLSGWFALESATQRWTNGHARLPAITLQDRSVILEIQILQAGPYQAVEDKIAA